MDEPTNKDEPVKETVKKTVKVDPDTAALERVTEMLKARPNGGSLANKIKAFLA